MKNQRLKVLYINHYGTFGGSQRSLLELIANFQEGMVEPHFMTPKGKDSALFSRLGIPHSFIYGGLTKFDHTKASYYKGIRWLILIREFLFVFPTLFAFLSLKKKSRDFDLVHINEITCVIPLILAKLIFKKPVVLHARAVFNNDPSLKRTKLILNILDKYADKIIAIDQTVQASIPISKKVVVVHNGFSIKSKLNDNDQIFRDRISLIPKRRLTIGFIGAIHRNKGILELLEAINMGVTNGFDINLIIAGTGNFVKHNFFTSLLFKTGLSQDKNKILQDFILENNLQDHVHTLGFSTNTVDFFKYIDVIAFPSYFNAVGRPVFEAAFFYKPAIVAIDNPYPDTFVDQVTGIQVIPRDSKSVYKAINQYYNNPELIKTLGIGANKLAILNFDVKQNAVKTMQVYESVIKYKDC